MNVALIGAGGIGNTHSNAYLQMPDVKIIAIVDIVEEKADKMAGDHNAKAYYSVEDMLLNEKPDMVDICVPSYIHKEISIQCMNAKIHTLCEKPIANDMQSALEMVEAAKKNGVLFMVAQVIRFWPEYMALKKIYDEKTYGKLKHAFFSRMSQAPEWGSGWYLDPEKSGMAPFELHIHDTDYINYLLGMPKAVKSYGIDDYSTFSSYLKTQFIYEEDMLIEAEGGWFRSPINFSMPFRAIFEKAVLEYRDDKLMLYPDSGEAMQIDTQQSVTVGAGINIKSSGGTFNEIRYFIDCIRTNKPIKVVPPQDSIKSLQLLLREIESAKSGNIIQL